jgi:uncharacterized protein (TIGR03086 family)
VFDLGPAAQEMTRLVAGVRDDQLAQPTPCPDWTVADLLTHVVQFTAVFIANGRRETAQPPDHLLDDWRGALPRHLAELAEVWREESAWHGRVSAGGVEMDASANAVVAIEELTTHGWDLARATGQHLEVEDAQLDQVDRFFDIFAPQLASGRGPFGPPVDVPEASTRLERTIARTGRDPWWAPAI